ncbi:hypothetical protein ANO14919_055000 [Xylariales sp. No.14919]|nr:hypothetical protein F5X98DRAFT_352147 [Xylaria grammica]GAW16077.1 hypothetical protein ANO14919_055000 [Xylariales sp. No.14919]
MLKSLCVYLSWITFPTNIRATQENADAIAASTAVRLADVQQCPVSPKPTCSEDSCQGSIFVGPSQFLCVNESPFAALDGRSVILAGCRCCPLPIEVWCHDHHCAAPEDARICTSNELQGCACMTGQDRLAAVEAAAEDYVWKSDDSVDLDIEPSSDEEEGATITTSSGWHAAAPTMAIMETPQRWPLRDIWSVYKLGQGC